MSNSEAFEGIDIDACVTKAKDVAIEAGKMINSALLSRDKHISVKGIADLVTETDKAVERFVFSSLRQTFPTHSFIGEETSAHETMGENPNTPTWICDPIDGTTNFVVGSPHCCVSIALSYRGKIVIGIINAPARNELFIAVLGRGATLNGSKIHVSSSTELSDAVVATNMGYGRDDKAADFMLGNVKKMLLDKVLGVRMGGSAALDLSYVACGRLCAFYEWGIHVWDIAAGSLMVQEAGGLCLDPNDAKKPTDLTSRRILAGNPAIAQKLGNLLNPKLF